MSNNTNHPKRTPAQSEASRRNGAKSNGPTSPEGKAISSQNACKHGLRARELHLAPDEQEAFNDLRDLYCNHYLPTSPFELHLIHNCVVAAWLLARAQTIQASLLDLELAEAGPEIEQTYAQIDRPGLLAIGFRLLHERTSAFSTLDAHQGRLLRQITRFTSLLEAARKTKKTANEPEPRPQQEQEQPQ